MNPFPLEKVTTYSKSQSRNRIVVHREPIFELDYINIGIKLSEAIFNWKDSNKLSMKSSMELGKLLEQGIKQHPSFGNYLAISNLGILFEEELKINFMGILDNYSKNNVLFVKWEGEMDADHLYFLTKEKGVKVNIKNLSHIKI